MRKIILSFTVILFIALFGCETNMFDSFSNDSGSTSDIEEAKMALDAGNYDKAISILQDDYNPSSPDPEIASILASAYMGKAGIDLTYAIEHMGTTETDHFDAISSALSLEITDQGFPSSSIMLKYAGPAEDAGARFITASSLAELLENLNQTEEILTTLIDYYTANQLDPDDDHTIQLGMASALHFILKVGSIICQVQDCNAPVDREAYLQVFPPDDDWVTMLDEVAAYIDSHDEDLSALRADLTNVYNAVRVLIENIGNEDITREFDGFMRDLLCISEDASEGAISAAIQAYNGSNLVDFVHSKLLGYN
jgi:hypothetical protein